MLRRAVSQEEGEGNIPVDKAPNISVKTLKRYTGKRTKGNLGNKMSSSHRFVSLEWSEWEKRRFLSMYVE